MMIPYFSDIFIYDMVVHCGMREHAFYKACPKKRKNKIY